MQLDQEKETSRVAGLGFFIPRRVAPLFHVPRHPHSAQSVPILDHPSASMPLSVRGRHNRLFPSKRSVNRAINFASDVVMRLFFLVGFFFVCGISNSLFSSDIVKKGVCRSSV